MRATVTDVAKLAGVSISTVSRVLNDNYPVSDDARFRVQRAIEELNYTPHYIASSLKSKKVNMLGVIIPKMTNRVLMQIAESIAEEGMLHGYKTLFAFSNNDKEREKAALNLFRSSLVDAIIVSTVMDDAEEFENIRKAHIPILLFERNIEGAGLDYVGDDISGNNKKITEYLISKGHRRILLTTGSKNISNTRDLRKGYKEALSEAGLEFSEDYVVEVGYGERQTYQIINEYLNKIPEELRPTAIIATSPPRAKGVLDAIYENNLSVPKDISVVSYGDIGLPKNFKPSITYITQDSIATGKELARAAIKKIEEYQKEEEISPPIFNIIPAIFSEGDSVSDLN